MRLIPDGVGDDAISCPIYYVSHFVPKVFSPE